MHTRLWNKSICKSALSQVRQIRFQIRSKYLNPNLFVSWYVYGHSQRGAHVGSKLCYLISIRQSQIRFFLRKDLFSCMRAQQDLSYHLIQVPWSESSSSLTQIQISLNFFCKQLADTFFDDILLNFKLKYTFFIFILIHFSLYDIFDIVKYSKKTNV